MEHKVGLLTECKVKVVQQQQHGNFDTKSGFNYNGEEELEMYLFTKYVDNINIVIYLIHEGW